MPQYSLLILDLDDTVVEFTQVRRECFVAAAAFLHPSSNGHSLYEVFCQESDRLWAGHKAGTVSLKEVREQRFANVLAGLPIEPSVFIEKFYEILGTNERVMPGAPNAVAELAKNFRLVGISNGRKEVQEARLKKLGLLKFFEFLLGPEDAGSAKPHPALFEMALRRTGVSKAEVLVVGDGMETDILGADGFGVDSAWLNLENRALREGEPTPNFTVANLAELSRLLLAAIS
jgi:HAD superfamily hydrolase (TIGR01549 family)